MDWSWGISPRLVGRLVQEAKERRVSSGLVDEGSGIAEQEVEQDFLQGFGRGLPPR